MNLCKYQCYARCPEFCLRSEPLLVVFHLWSGIEGPQYPLELINMPSLLWLDIGYCGCDQGICPLPFWRGPFWRILSELAWWWDLFGYQLQCLRNSGVPLSHCQKECKSLLHAGSQRNVYAAHAIMLSNSSDSLLRKALIWMRIEGVIGRRGFACRPCLACDALIPFITCARRGMSPMHGSEYPWEICKWRHADRCDFMVAWAKPSSAKYDT